MKRIVYLSNVSWSSFSQRAHMFAYWAHERHDAEILWIEPYPARFPRWNDIKRWKAGAGQPRHQPQWLTLLKPLALPIEPMPSSGRINRWVWASVLQQTSRFLSGGESLVAIGKPSELALQVLQGSPGTPSLYDAMDDVPEFFSGLAKKEISRREDMIARRATQIWASSQTLIDKYTAHSGKTQLVLNACTSINLPEPMIRSQRDPASPVLGYVGAIAQWFDWPWVIRLAQSLPWARLRLIGPLINDAPEHLPSNIELLPACAHEEALLHMQSFDVGLIPFHVTPLTESVDPIKYYEYKAMGLPVLSTRFGQMRMRKDDDQVFFADMGVSMPQLLQRALACRVNREQIEVFREQNIWRLRFESAELSFV
jgi:glycosyltransferase involved in cell wall biosynthesis